MTVRYKPRENDVHPFHKIGYDTAFRVWNNGRCNPDFFIKINEDEAFNLHELEVQKFAGNIEVIPITIEIKEV